MAIRLTYRGAVIEAETREDFDNVLLSLGLREENRAASQQFVEGGAESSHTSPSDNTVKRALGNLVERLQPDQRRFLTELSRVSKMSSEEMCERLGIEREALGNILKGLSRRAFAAQINAEKQIVSKRVSTRNGQRVYDFKLMPAVREYLPK